MVGTVIAFAGGAMESDDELGHDELGHDELEPGDEQVLDEYRLDPAGWSLEHELEIAAEVYGPEPKGHRASVSDLSDEEVVERFRSLLGFDVKWE
jgi:hypothetical protein